MGLDTQPQKLNAAYMLLMPFFLFEAIGSYIYLQHKHNDCGTYYDRTQTIVLWKDCK